MVVPDGVLHDLPFSLLLTKPVPETAWSYRTLPYLIRERAVSVLPSATVAGLITHRTDEGTVFHRELVAFGDPVAPGADRQTRLAVRLIGPESRQVFVTSPRADELPPNLELPVWTVNEGKVT